MIQIISWKMKPRFFVGKPVYSNAIFPNEFYIRVRKHTSNTGLQKNTKLEKRKTAEQEDNINMSMTYLFLNEAR